MGIRDLKAHMSEAIKEVREGDTIEVTSRGEVVALLVPVRRKVSEADRHAAIASTHALIAEISQYATEPIDVTQMLGEMRR